MDHAVLATAFLLLFACATTTTIVDATPDRTSVVERVEPVERRWIPTSLSQQTTIMDNILNDYDKRVRPGSPYSPLEVKLHARIMDVYNIDEKNHEFTVSLYLRQEWNDSRLNFEKHAAPGMNDVITFGPEQARQIWIPDVFFVNDREATIHDFQDINEFTRVSRNGQVLRSTRITVRASCPMNLKWFPFDRHTCTLQIESYAHTAKDFFYTWKRPITVDMSKQTSSINFKVPAINFKDSFGSSVTGNYSRAAIEFFVVRVPTRYFQDVYFPSVALPILAFITLFMSTKTFDAVKFSSVIFLVTVIFTALLAMEMPKVSYQTALDFYVFNSSVMIFNAVCVNFVLYQVLKGLKPKRSQKLQMMQLNGTNSEEAKDFYEDVEHAEVQNPKPIFSNKLFHLAFKLCEKSKYTMPFFFVVFNIIYWVVVLYASSQFPEDFLLVENEHY